MRVHLSGAVMVAILVTVQQCAPNVKAVITICGKAVLRSSQITRALALGSSASASSILIEKISRSPTRALMTGTRYFASDPGTPSIVTVSSS